MPHSKGEGRESYWGVQKSGSDQHESSSISEEEGGQGVDSPLSGKYVAAAGVK